MDDKDNNGMFCSLEERYIANEGYKSWMWMQLMWTKKYVVAQTRSRS